MLRDLVLVLASISFVIVIGGAVYEHLALVPVWVSAVPASLTVFQGDHALKAQNFWIPIHPITMLLLVFALILNWRSERRGLILTTIVGYLSVLVITFLYFVPELMAITQTPFSETVDAALTARAGRWETLSLIRLGFLLILAVVLLFSLTRQYDPYSRRH